jgi:transposase InsO family protein
MIKDAVANYMSDQAEYGSSYVARNRNSKTIINRVLQLLFAPDVSLRRLDGSVPERWSMDFVSDCVSTGRVVRMLTLVDDCTRECPVIEVDTSLGDCECGAC